MKNEAMKTQHQIFFNKLSLYQQLSEYIECVKDLLDYAKGKKFDPYNKEQDLIWIGDFKFIRQRLSHLVSSIENERKDSVDLFLKEKKSLSKQQKSRFVERNIALKAQIAQTHLIIKKMMAVESKIDPNDEIA